MKWGSASCGFIRSSGSPALAWPCIESNHGVGHLETAPADTPEQVKYEQEMTLGQARWLGLSSNAKQIFARHSSEYIQFDEPDTVISAIREVYDQSKNTSRSAR